MGALKRATAAASRGPLAFVEGAQIPEGGEKCTVSGSPQCALIVDAIAGMNGEIYDGLVQAQRLLEDFLAQTKELESQQEGAEVKMATAVRTLNENGQTQEMKNKQAKDLEDQLTAKR